MENPREILVRGPNWTGDVIMATPGFRALRAGFPEARITLHLRESQVPLLRGASWFDEIVPLRAQAGRGWAPIREARALGRGRAFDLGVCLPDSFSSALSMRVAGVRHIVGYGRNGRSLLLHRAVPLPKGTGGGRGGPMLPRELHVIGLVEALGCARQGLQLELPVVDEERAEAAAAFEAAGGAPQGPYAVLAPGASFGPSKIWPPENFARVGDALSERGVNVVLIGTPAEVGLTRDVRRWMRTPVVDLTGKLSLGALKAAVQGARVMVCNDAGARHVAVAFGVPCVVTMGPTALEKTGLNLEGVQVLTADVPCRPCYRRECPIDHRCMTQISPDRVLAAALPALGPTGAAA
ncbi:MAG: glycosyltransferase family 9 protein [Myxococcales bacterium]|nr:glycosyltransferase family 9 protein [Myxococcales bacterium]